MTSPRERAEPAGDERLARVLGRAHERAAALGRPVLAALTQPLAAVAPLELFARAEGTAAERVYWEQPSERFAMTGVGVAVALEPSGAHRFTDAGRQWRELLATLVHDGPAGDGHDGAGPLLMGGFSFDAERGDDGRWSAFPAARLVVPRLLVATTPAGCWRTTSALVAPHDDPAALALALAREERALLAGLAGPLAARSDDEPPPLVLEELHAADAWRAAVASAARAVRDGEVEKVVLARAVQARATRALDVSGALRGLREDYPACYVFAVARGRQTFLGATPERLVRLDGREVRATALAGSIRRGATPEEDARLARTLLASTKDRTEHGYVVHGLRDALAPLCDEIAAPAEPALLSVSNVHHLYTPVVARLRDGYGLPDLLARVHPTPAVAGLPREAALARIRALEPMDRGWYAAPVGWIGADGSGEFAVALRSALVEGNEATLFAGCGIVGDSDPTEEYAESVLKLRPMRLALGEDDA